MSITGPDRLFRDRTRTPTRGSRGFTLVELLVVVVVLVALAAISVPLFSSQSSKAKDSSTRATVGTISRFIQTSLTTNTTLQGAQANVNDPADTIESSEGKMSKDGAIVFANATGAWCVSKQSPTGAYFSASSTNPAPTETAVGCANANSSPTLAGFNWTSKQSASDSRWSGVAYGNGLFVAVANTTGGNVGTESVMTSPDGTTWTLQESPVGGIWQKVEYLGGQFIAVGDGSLGKGVMTSPDGITWTARTTPGNATWYGVTYGNGLYVAVGGGGTDSTKRVMTSTDGITWTQGTSVSGTGIIRDVEYGNGIFVAVTGSAYAMWSADGVTWNLKSSAYTAGQLSLIYRDGKFVSTGIAAGTNPAFFTTVDGIAWTPTRLPTGISSWYGGVTYGNGLYVSVAQTGSTNRVLTSPDGITWTYRDAASSNNWNAIAYGNGTFVAVSNTGTGNRVMTSK